MMIGTVDDWSENYVALDAEASDKRLVPDYGPQ